MCEITMESVHDALLDAGLVKFWDSIRIQPSVRGRSPIVVITLKSHDITFKELSLISEALGTREINLDNEVRESGYCDTCRHSYSITVITVMEARLPDLQGETHGT